MTDVMKENLLQEKEVSRKSFLKGGSALVVGMSLAGVAEGRAQAVTDYSNPNPGHRGTGTLGSSANIDWWIQFNSNGTLTQYDNSTEVGNGTPTNAAALVAEELNMTLSQIRLAPLDSNNTGNTSERDGSGGAKGLMTAGAGSTARSAAAGARNLMINMAAQQWGVQPSTLSVNWGVISSQDGRKVSYFALMGDEIFGYPQAGGVNPKVLAANPLFTGTIVTSGQAPGAAVASAPVLKAITSPSSYLPSAGMNEVKLITQRLPRTTIPDIVTGKYTYNQNVYIPGMLHGRVVRPRGQGRADQPMKVLSIDTTSISHIPNVQVVRKGQGFTAVVAPVEYDAIQAAAQLKVTWDNTPLFGQVGSTTNPGTLGSDSLAFAMRSNPAITKSAGSAWGAANAAIGQSAATISASFVAQHTQHAPFGPNAAIVSINTNNKTPGGTAWVYNQGGNPSAVIAAAGLPNTVVANTTAFRFISSPGSGTYGHSQYDDCAIAAAICSAQVGAPVRVQYMRWDETGWDFAGPPVLLDVVAGVDANGRINALKYGGMGPAGGGTEPTAAAYGTTATLEGTAASQPDATAIGLYTVTGTKTARTMTGYGMIRNSYLRAPGTPQATFAWEQVVDMLAHVAKMDPIAFRKLNLATANLATYGLSLDTLQKAAGWKPRVAASELDSGNIVRGRGVAINGFGGSYPAGIAEVEVNRKTGKISVLNYYAVQNNGLSGLTSSVENQMSGCVVQGTSRALHETTAFSPSRQLSVDWVTYPILRFKDTPTVTTITLPLISAPGGSGEPSTVPVPAAIANAFFDATGVRAFQYPMTTAYTRGVLQAAAKGITPLPVGIKAGMALFTD